MFSPVDTKTPLAKQEEKVIDFWKKEKILEKSILEGKKLQPFSFYDGPPFATGLPHYGHLLVSTIKDVVLRYKAMQGFQVSRRFGWDCHGLPVENEIEKAKGLSGAASIEAFGIDMFNEECRSIVLRYTSEWESTVLRFGRWVDFSDTYRTMDPPFMESVWWVFAELWRRGLIYEGYKVMPYSAKLGTPLSNFEASENYKEVDDPSIVVALTLEQDENCSLLIWTTTPWTLPSNLAVMVHPEIEYLVLEHKQTKKRYIIAEPRAGAILKDIENYREVGRMKGIELEGTRYKPLFPFFLQHKDHGAFRVIMSDFVQLDEGTGLVHSAPGFGEVDFYACQKAGIPVACPVDQNGKFTDEVQPYQGRFVKDCDKEIIRELKNQGRILIHDTIRHRYPFCWRSDTPLIYKAVSTWFVAVEKIKDRLLRANDAITWVPEHIKYGRFGKWLENARDWAISRNRYWGTPIPLWRSDDGECIVVESREQLRELTGASPDDLHRHFIDDLTITKDGKVYRRIPEVFDCWFESGSMPYAQLHYPFENQERFAQLFPAEFIAEALDQTRGWFYTLTVLGAALFDSPAFKNVVVNGIVLAADGTKMSKRLRNYPDPLEVVGKYGADAVRLYMLGSPVVHGDDLCFSEAGVELVLRQVFLPLWNAVSFFVTYARIYSWEPFAKLAICEVPANGRASISTKPIVVTMGEERSELCHRRHEQSAVASFAKGSCTPPSTFAHPKAEIDRWLLSITAKLIADVEEDLDRYDLSTASLRLQPFVDHLTNWYIRRSRRRFWSDEDSQDRREAFETLYQVLMAFSKVAACLSPFTMELIWQTLRAPSDPESVHLSRYPQKNAFPRDLELEAAHGAAQLVVRLAHALRKSLKLKVRQPLPKAFVVTPDTNTRQLLASVKGIIADEINVKEIDFSDDEHPFVTLKAKPNFRVLGKRVGSRMPAVQHALEHLHYSKLQELLAHGTLALHLEDGTRVDVSKDEVEVVRLVRDSVVAMHEGGMTVALEVTLDEALLAEGLAREVVNKLNTMRREQDLAVTDRIAVTIQTTQTARAALEPFMEYIKEETLAASIVFGPAPGGTEWDLNGEMSVIAISKS